MIEKNYTQRKVYGRLKGKPLKSKQQALMESLLPKIKLNIESIPSNPFYLEIGFGAGEHLAHRAGLEPHETFVGCEPFLNGVASLVRFVGEKGLQNVWIHHGDARDVLDALPPHSLKGVFILFADPWPKLRHHKRRMIGTENLLRLSELLIPGGLIYAASDHGQYATWIEKHLNAQKSFERVLTFETGSALRPENWVQTRYELKGLSEGRSSKFFIYRKT